MESITFHRSRARTAATSAGAAFFAGLCYLMTVTGETVFHRAFGWFGALFFAAIAVTAFPRIFGRSAAFTIDATGVHDHARRVFIPWRDVSEARVVTVRGIPFLGLWFRDRDAVLSRVSWLARTVAALNERTGAGHWTFSFTTVSPGIGAAMDFIREHVRGVATR